MVTGRNWRKGASQSGVYYSGAKMESDTKILQAIFDHAALGIAQISLDGSWLRVNNRYCEMLGYSESELLTRKIWDITRPPDYDEVSRGRRQLLEGAISSHTMEKRFVRKDGTIFWGRLNRSLVRDHDKQPQYFIAVVEDITEKVSTERALRDSEQRLTLAQSAAHLGVCQWDLSANVLTYSEEYARLYGQSPDDPPLTLEDLAKRTHPEDRERVQANIRDALERTHAWDTEYRVLWADGSVHWLHSKGAVFVDAAGRPVSSTGVILDVTERKRAEAALHRSQEQYRELFEHMNEGLAFCKMIFENGIGSDFIFLVVNPRFEVLTGLKDVIGKRATEVLPRIRDLDSGELEVYGRVALTGTPVRFEKFINVFEQWFAVSAYSPEKGFVGLVFDVITERKRIEEALTEQLKFETLLAELSATFINLPANQVDGQIKEAQKRICETLGLDRSTLGQLLAARFTITHSWTREGFEPPPRISQEDVPWVIRTLMGGQRVSFVRIDDLPKEAVKDKESLRRIGQKSNLIFPLSAGGKVFGALAFGTLREEREWPAPLIERLGLVAEVFANAMARQRAHEELQTAYSELRQQKEMLQTIFDHIPMMINSGDGKFGIQMVNRAWEQTLGWTLDEIRRDNVDILVENYPDPQYREHVRDFVLASNGEWANFKTTVRDGRVIDTSWMMLHLPDGTNMGMGQDITERKRAEEALRENEQRLVSIYNTVADVVYHLAVEPSGRFRFLSVNPAFLRTTGLSLEAVVGKTVNEVIPEPSLTMVLGKYRQAIEENAIVHWEETSDYLPGRLTGEVSVAPVFDDNGTCTSLVGSVHDITERKRAEKDLATSRDEIRAHAVRLVTAQEDERRRLSIEVHDQICQDLGSIAIELGGCAAKPPRREDVAARLRALQARVVKAATEAGHIAYQLHPSVLDDLGLPSALRDLCNRFAERARTIALEFTSGALPPSVPREVAACLYRIAQESLQNTARHSSAKRGSVALTWQDRTIVLMITDDGVGFDPQLARENGGLGIIGMEERARSVNGKLTITSQPGSGTRIALEVPLPLPAP